MYWNFALFFLFTSQIACSIHNGNLTNSYIVSDRNLIGKKLRQIAKIAKVGLKIVAIANPGGLALLKTIAVAKAKELAIKKGLQCLKNGLSNFCNGKKKIGKFSGKLKISTIKARVSKVKGKVSKIKARVSKVKGKVSKIKARVSKVKGKVRNKIKNKLNCKNYFDSIAEKINNATNRIIEKPVNKGRDWLKKNIGGKTNCVNTKKTTITNPKLSRNDDSTPRPKKIRVKPAPVINNDDSTHRTKRIRVKPAPVINNDDSTHRTKRIRVKPAPVTNNDDSTPRPKKIRVKPAPVTNNDDSTPRPKRIRVKPEPVTNTDDSTPRPKKIRVKPAPVINNDDSTPKPIRLKRRPPINNDDEIDIIPRKKITPSQSQFTSTMPTIRFTNNPSTNPSFRPTRLPKNKLSYTNSFTPTIILTNKPTKNPSFRPTVTPIAKTSIRPTVPPTRVPTNKPSPNPSLVPTQFPTITQISWAAFSSAPVIVRPSSFPTLVPTTPMFNIITNSPILIITNRPSVSPTVINTHIPSQNPTIKQDISTFITNSPSFKPSINPTLFPTPIPTILPTTNNPTISDNSINSLNANKNDNNNQINVTNITIATVILFVVILLVIAFLCFSKKSVKHDPYQIWTNFYEEKQNRASENMSTDIHHFYNKPAPPSIHSKPAFVPYVSTRFSIQPNSRL
jgi:hypothetical protein